MIDILYIIMDTLAMARGEFTSIIPGPGHVARGRGAYGTGRCLWHKGAYGMGGVAWDIYINILLYMYTSKPQYHLAMCSKTSKTPKNSKNIGPQTHQPHP